MTDPRPLEPGLWVVLATPFDDTLAVDQASLGHQLDLARRVGATGVVALGVFGEAAALSLGEQREVTRTVIGATDLPIVIGLSARTTAAALEQAVACLEVADARVAGVMAQVHSTRADVVVEHLERLHVGTGVGVVLQDYPSVSGVVVGNESLVEIVRGCPFVVAVKAEAPPTAPAIADLTAAVELPVFGGLGGVGLVDELAAGASGAMTGFSHPEGLRATLEAHAQGGFAPARAAWSPWLPLANFEGQAGIGLALRKEILYRRGLLSCPAVRPPAPTVPPRLLPILEQHLRHLPDHQTSEA